MDQDRPHGALVETSEIVELRGGRVWELTTASCERVVVDRGFRPNGASTRSRWRRDHGAWRRLFGVRPVDVNLAEGASGSEGLRVVIGSRLEVWTGFRDIWPTETPLVAVRTLEQPEA